MKITVIFLFILSISSCNVVRENLEIGAFLRDDDVNKVIEEIYELFPVLSEKKMQKVGELSGGALDQKIGGTIIDTSVTSLIDLVIVSAYNNTVPLIFLAALPIV